jgi:hypothetical protein
MTEEHPNVTLARIVCGDSTEALAKDLAIKLAISDLKKLQDPEYVLSHQAELVIKNLLIGLGCEAVVDAWNEVG